MQSDPGDTLFNNYILEHSYRSVFDESYEVSVWSPEFFYPQRNVLSYGDNLWGAAPFYWLARVFLPPDTSFQAWMILMVIFNFLAFYFLARQLKINTWIAAITAFIFIIGLPRMGQFSHQQLMPQFFSFLSLLFLFRFINNRKFYNLLIFEGLLYLQMLSSIYLGWLFIFSLAIFIPANLIYHRNKELIKSFFSLQVIASYVVLLFILLITFRPYYLAQQELGKWRYEGVSKMIPQAASYFSFAADNILYNLYPKAMLAVSNKLPMSWEHHLFLGFFPILLLAVSVISFIMIKRRESLNVKWPPLFIISLITFVVLTSISLQFKIIDYSFWRNIYDYFPGAGGIRVVTRIWLVSYLFLFLGTASLTSYVYEKTKRKDIKVILLIVGLLACLEQINVRPSYFNKLEHRRLQLEMDTSIAEALSKKQVDAFYLRWVLEDEPFYRYQLMAMWSGLNLQVPTVNGYSGKRPVGYQDISVAMTDDSLVSWIDYKRPGDLKNILVFEARVKESQWFFLKNYNLIIP